MRTGLIAAGLGMLASGALAHGGAHLHPHGAGSWLTLALAGVLVVVAVVVARSGR